MAAGGHLAPRCEGRRSCCRTSRVRHTNQDWGQQMSERQGRENAQEFTISLEGAELPPEVVDRIHRALHRVVLQEIAEIDVASRHGVRFLGLDGALLDGGRTQGIQAQIVEL
jgi:hypothetical protein